MKKVNILILTLVLTYVLSGTASAIGQVTSPIVIENALQGEEYQQTLIVVNTEKTATSISFEAEGDIKDWVRFYKADNPEKTVKSLLFAAGARMDIIADFTVPDGTSNGDYKGYVSVLKKAETDEDSDESSAVVAQKVDREVTISVSVDEIIKIDASIIPKSYDLKKGEPLIFRVIYASESNVDVEPQIQLKIKKDNAAVYNAIFPYPETEDPIKFSESREIPSIEIPTNNFAGGKYLAEVNILNGGESVSEQKFSFSYDQVFNDPVGDPSAAGKSIKIKWGILGIIAPAIFVAAILIISKGVFRGRIKLKRPIK